MINRLVRFAGICYLMIFSGSLIAADQDARTSAVTKAMRSISAAECLEHVEFLTNDECAGRGTASNGYDTAATYIAKQFALMNLKPAVAGDSYLQKISVDRNILNAENLLALYVIVPSLTGNDTLVLNYDMNDDFLPVGSAKKADLSSELVFAGYGITSMENDWDDYKDIDVRGKVVLVLRGVPPIEGADFGRLFSLRHKARFAAEAGAAGILAIGNPIGTISSRQNIPAVVVKETIADNMLKGTGYTVQKIMNDIKTNGKSITFQLPHRVRLKIESELKRDLTTSNIVGYVQGSDPELRDEFIVVGAHADHIGQIGDLTFYGANDNASGTSVVIEIAEAFAEADTLPKRSVLFIAFTGEEMGLLGSRHYCANPLFDIKKTKAMINLDMVGIGDDAFMIVGGKSYPGFAKLFDKCSEKSLGIPIRRRWTSPNSDHYPFHEVGVPSVFLYTMGDVPPTYHTPQDIPETLDAEVMESVGRLAFGVIWELANKKKISFKYVEKSDD